MKFSIRPGHAFSQEPPNRPANFFKLFSCEVGLPNGKFPRRSVAVKENYFHSPFLPWFFELSSSTEWNIVAPGGVPKRYDGREVRLCVPKRKTAYQYHPPPALIGHSGDIHKSDATWRSSTVPGICHFSIKDGKLFQLTSPVVSLR